MSIETKKKMIADKMYKQNGTGGQGKLSEKYNQTGKGKGNVKIPKMTGDATGSGKGEKYPQSNGKGSFNAKYNQANPSGSIKGGYSQANC